MNTEVLVKEKPKVLLVGGMDYNVPPQIKEHFDVVRHITHGSKFQTFPKADYVFVITEWAGHNLVEAVKAGTNAPVINLPRGGWEAIKQDLRRRSILPPEAQEQTPAVVETKSEISADSLFSSMTEADVWKKYGSSLIEAAQTTLKPKEVLCEDDVLEALSLSGVPKDDCKVFLVKLQMKGILDPVSEGRWRLMAAPGVDFENDRVKVDSEEEAKKSVKGKAKAHVSDSKPEIGFGGSFGTDAGTGRRQVRSPELLGMIAGLPPGPYASKRALFHEIRKYSSFDGLSDWQVTKYIDRAIEAKIVDDTRSQIYVNHDSKIGLARAKAPVLEPDAPEKLMGVAAPDSVGKSMQDYSDKIGKKVEKNDAEKSWCYVVEAVKKEKDRLGGVLEHCRIEWMGDNKVLVIFIPSALVQWQKFLESTENWGLVTRLVQDKISRGTAIRFMVENGLRV